MYRTVCDGMNKEELLADDSTREKKRNIKEKQEEIEQLLSKITERLIAFKILIKPDDNVQIICSYIKQTKHKPIIKQLSQFPGPEVELVKFVVIYLDSIASPEPAVTFANSDGGTTTYLKSSTEDNKVLQIKDLPVPDGSKRFHPSFI